jgi:hypothetical protein
MDHHHHQNGTKGCFEQKLVQNVEFFFVVVHHEDAKSEFEEVLLWFVKLANMLEYTREFHC